MNNKDFSVRVACWAQDISALKKIREIVFVMEQKVPVELEWDDKDETAIHVLAVSSSGEEIGTGRLLPNGQVGRMAVLSNWRNSGVGSKILSQLLIIAKNKEITPLFLNAQVSAIAFYKRHGFQVIGNKFMEAGISHQRMEKME